MRFKLTNYKKSFGLVCLFLLVLLSFSSPQKDVDAVANSRINFQSKIVNRTTGLNVVAGSPSCIVGGADTCDFRISIYSDASGGTLLWREPTLNVEIGDVGGYFSIEMNAVCNSWTAPGGSCSGAGIVWGADDTVYIEVELDSDGNGDFTSGLETFARKLFTSVPYAYYADSAGSINGLTSGDFVNFRPAATQTTTSTNTLINLESTATAATNPLVLVNENGTGTPNLLQLQVAGNNRFQVANGGGLTINTTTNSSLINLVTTATAATNALFIANENGTGTPNLVQLQVAGTDRFVVGNAGNLVLSQLAQTTGTPSIIDITGGASTGLTASAEIVDINFNLARVVQRATGAVATQRAALFQAPTYSFVGASVITDAATLAITGAPVAGTNATITNSYALWTQAGANRFDGNVLAATTTNTAFLNVAPATTAQASMRLVSSAGTNPTTPNSGDLWWNGTNLNFRTASTTVDLLGSAGGPFVNFTPATAQTTTSTNSLISLESTATAATNPLILVNENGTGTPDLLRLQVASGNRFVVGNAGNLTISQLAQTSGSPSILNLIGGASTGLTAGTEILDVNFNLARTVQRATGAVATQRAALFQAPTYSFVGASVITDAATLAISAAPIAGTNATITNSYALLVESGNTRLSGRLAAGSTLCNGIQQYVICNSETITAAASSTNAGVYSQNTFNGSNTNTQNISGWFRGTYDAGLTNYNVASSATFNTVGSSENTGLQISLVQAGASNLTGSLYGSSTSITNTNSATVSTASLINVALQNSGGGTITNTYGLFVGDITSGTQTNQAYSIYASDTNARNYLAGRTSLGTLTDTAFATIAAATTAQSSIRIVSSGGTNPTTPNSGDLWWNGTNLNFRTASTTVDLLTGGGGGGPFVDFTPAAAQTTTSTNSLISLVSTATAATNPLVLVNENGTGTPDLLRLQVAGVNRFIVLNNGRTAIGSSAVSSAQLYVENQTAANTGFTIRAAASQSTNIATWEDSSGTVLGGVSATGNIFNNLGTANTNLFLGPGSGSSTNSGSNNTTLGNSVLSLNGTGSSNTGLGAFALNAQTSGNNNVAVGSGTLSSNINGSGNVALGFEAGANETGSNTLYIANDSTNNPLIFGDFANARLAIGTLTRTASLNVRESTAAQASFRLVPGATNPTTPNSGDLWWNGTNLNFRTTSTTVDLLAAGSAGPFVNFTPATAQTTTSTNSLISLESTATSATNPLILVNENGTGVPDLLRLQNAGTNRFVVSNAGNLTISQLAQTSGTPSILSITGGVHTGLTGSTEIIDLNFNLGRVVQRVAGGVTSQRSVLFQSPTYSFAGASTITNAATVAITGAPAAGTNATITNRYSLWVETGTVKIQDRVEAGDAFIDSCLTVQATLGCTGFIAIGPNGTGTAQIRLESSGGVNVSAPPSGALWWNGTNLNFYNGTSNIDLLAGAAGAFINFAPSSAQSTTSTNSLISLTSTATAATNPLIIVNENGTGTPDLLNLRLAGTNVFQVGNNGTTSINTTTTTAFLNVAPATTAKSALRLVASVAIDPTTPNSGDLWWNGTALNFSNGTVTRDLFGGTNGYLQFAPAASQTTTSTNTLINLTSTATASTNPLILVNENGTGTPDLFNLQVAGANVFSILNNGDIEFATGATRNIVDDAGNNLVQITDIATNFGATVEAGAMISRNSQAAEEFQRDRADVAADTVNAFGDIQTFTVDEQTNCTFSTVDDSVNGLGRSLNGAINETCMVYNGAAVGNLNLTYDADNLPVIIMKARPNRASANDDTWIGIGDTVALTATDPANGIYFTNNNGTTWTGVTRSASTSTNVTCTGATVSTTQFALMKIEVRSTTDVRFYVDADVSDGVAWISCGTSATNIPTVGLASFWKWSSTTINGTLDVDYYRSWQDDNVQSEPVLPEVETAAPEVTEPREVETEVTEDAEITEENTPIESEEIPVEPEAVQEVVEPTLEESITQITGLRFIQQSETGQLQLSPSTGTTTIALGSDTLVQGNLTVAGTLAVQGDVTIAGDLVLQGDLKLSESNKGNINIPIDATEVDVVYSVAKEVVPTVIINQIDGAGVKYWVNNSTVNGFKITIDAAAVEELEFSWTLIN